MHKITRLLAGIAVAMLNAPVAQALTTEYTELDGVYYNVPVGSQMLTVDGSTGSWIMPSASMLNCAPQGGVANYSAVNLLYDPNYDLIFLTSGNLTCSGSPSPTSCVVTLTSTAGNMICTGALSGPPDRIFANGFN